MEKLQNYSTNAFKKTEEAELKALNSLKKAREEFGSLNNQSTLLALAYPSEAAAISEKQLALKKAMPYLEQAQKDLSCYLDCDDNFIESEWWALKEIWNKKLLYKGFKIVPYCPRCGTPLSAQEVSQGYKTVKERSAVVRFKVIGEDAYFLAWTTTPWTLPSNIGLCVNPEETYAKVKAADGYVYYMAEALLDTVLGRLADEEAGTPAYEVLETYKGKDLEYKEYEPLYQCAADVAEKQHKKCHFVTCDTYVTLTDGTGVVHIAPAFGEDDARVGRKYDAPFVQMVDEAGVMKPETPFAGMRAKPTKKEMEAGAINCDVEVLKELESRGILFSAPKVEHEYPHCWRWG